MSEETEKTANKAKLFAKVAKVMTAVRTLPKDGENTYDKYKYIKGDDAFERIGYAMAANNLVALPSIIECTTQIGESGSGKPMLRTVVHLAITLADGDTGETWTGDWYGEGADRGDKSINKAITAAMKYYLLRVFNVGSGEDADEESPEVTKPAAKAQQPAQRQAALAPQPQAQHRQPEAPVSNGNGTTGKLDIEATITKWNSPKDAMDWAVEGRYTENEHSARTRWSQIVDDDFSGKCTTKNIKDVMRAYAAHYINKPVTA